MIEAVGVLDDFAKGEVTRKDDILAVESDDESAMNGPWPDARDPRELSFDLIVRQARQLTLIQSPVGEVLGKVTERRDLPSRQARCP
jgi:hypothetical protein